MALGAAALIAIGGFPGDESPRQSRPGESASETVEWGESAARAAERAGQPREKRAAGGEEPQPAKARVEDEPTGPATREPTGSPEEQAATPPPGGAPPGSAPSGSVNSGAILEPAPLPDVEVQGEVQVEVPPVVP